MNTTLAFMLTLLAGLSTCAGSGLAFTIKKTDDKFLSLSLGFAAGVMLYISMADLLGEARETLAESLGAGAGGAIFLAFFGGMCLFALLDRIVPHGHGGHEHHHGEEVQTEGGKKDLLRIGIYSAVAISIHNIPEGIATFVSALYQPVLAVPIVLAIMLHNIPVGIAIAAPVYYATGNKKKAFIATLLTGLTQPLGAALAYWFLMPFLSETLMALLLAGAAGIMVFIALELLPMALKRGDHHYAIYGAIGGMAVIAGSLLLL